MITARPLQDGPDLIGNDWLASLPPEVFERLRPSLNRIVTLNYQDTVLNIGDAIDRLWFPMRGTAGSLFCETGDADAVEVAQIGCEGAFGLYDLGMGRINGALYQARIWAEGPAYEVAADAIRGALGQDLHPLIASYAHSITSQITQSLICRDNHKRCTHKRLARWLLQAQDRTGRYSFDITQEEFALKLGITRRAVCNAGQTLEEMGLIHRGHGKIVIDNREGLIAEACPCYSQLPPANRSSEIIVQQL